MARPRSLVTGAAGFIGSHLCERLVNEGHEVVGLDCFTDYYPRSAKESNLSGLRREPRFHFVEGDLVEMELGTLMKDLDYIFHQAAQAGVRRSWGQDFSTYLRNNVSATQRLLEEVKKSERGIRKLVYASSSSVYGSNIELPMREDAYLQPFSPYGVTKLAAEHLCHLYWENYGIPIVSLRYFTIYGPRQRPDMAFHRFIRSALQKEPILIYGDGEQTRDFTYISDAVEANLLSLREGVVGKVFNIGGGCRISITSVIKHLENILGHPIQVNYQPALKGEMRHTYADCLRARTALGYFPKVSIVEGLTQEWAWLKGELETSKGN
ncbi:MAG: NAD-dependent epimerase/dehydratase family protein [candidate division NC10 bacterium]|nr:NAD-dependent epimerase/dehydratase family protein [candidate division NC10 bacterium]